MNENQKIRTNLKNESIGSYSWFPVSDTSDIKRFGKIISVKDYNSYKVYEILFEDKSKAFLSDKILKD